MRETDLSAEPVEPSELEFDSLLRRAAHVSVPRSRSAGYRALVPGQSLLGGRLRVRRRIGAGGMGVVYEAYDEHRRGPVALKLLNRMDADGVYRLKQEFRSLADVTHPHLCRLHELFGEEDWFFTMELVAGQRFDRWVRPGGRLDEPRLRTALAQLCQAVAAIHAAGKLHRDLKPSNVLVTPEGRVVVLDFGLAMDRDRGAGQTTEDDSTSGTPAYMAPEQAAGIGAVPASDFYALGSMLFEALTGRCPFEGRVGVILMAKQCDAAPLVRELCPEAAPDLATLCDALVAREPSARPEAREIEAALGPPLLPPAPPRASQERESLLGRAVETAQLRASYETMLEQRVVVVFVEGESGMGKTALVNDFLDDLRAQGDAALLLGRCYERESVPFKAFDSVVDDLGRYLRRLTAEEASALMPREVFALARLFPTLDRVAAVASAPRKDIPDPQELQQRAFAAFGELLGRIRDRRPLVVHVDDLQWTDRDSSVFMEYLFAAPDPVPMLLVCSHRSEGAEDNPLLQQTLRAAWRNPRIDCRQIRVGRLSPEATRQLAARMLDGEKIGEAATIADEALGSPFFVGELVRHARFSGAADRKLTLQEAVVGHVESLDAQTRGLLDVLAVAGRPLSVRLALDAANAPHEAVDQLLAAHLLRASGAGNAERKVECYHDKIRECVAASLAPEPLRVVHQHLADQLSVHDPADTEHLALHYHGAGQLELAASHYERSGDAASGALAFDHAVRQYEQALALAATEHARGLRVKLGHALASAGSSRAAAETLRTAAAGAPADQALEHLRTAAHLLMTSGYLDEGRPILRDVLSAIGLSMPRSLRGAIASALVSRARLKLRGLRIAPADTLTPEGATHLRALWTVVQGSVGNAPFLMVEMASRHARLALAAGSKAHAARGLSMEAYLGSFPGPLTRARTEGLLARAQVLADEVSEPELTGWVLEIRGAVLVHEGRFAEARPVLRQALDCFETRCRGVPFELAGTRLYDLNAANHLGDLAELSTTASGIVDNSLRRGDMYQACGVASFAVQGWLAHMGLEHARSRFEEAKRLFQPQSDFQWIDYLTLMADLNLALYEGEGRRGFSLVQTRWPVMERAQLLRMQIALVVMHFCRGACLLVAARDGASPGELHLVDVAIRTLGKSPLGYARGWGAVLQAGLALLRGQRDRAAERLRAATSQLDGAGLRMYAAAARRRLGQLVGGEEGAALLREGDATMARERVVDLDATTEMLAPGCRA